MLKKLDVFSDEKLNDKVIFPEEKVETVRNWLSQLSQYKGNACVLWDTDTDGSIAGKVTNEELTEGYPNINIFNYMHETKVHGINNNVFNFLIDNKCELLICVDCGSSDYPYVKRITDEGIKVLIMDHHLIENLAEYLDNELVCLVNSQLLDVEYQEISGAMVCLQFMTQVTDNLELFGKLMESAILTIVSDICETKHINVSFLNNFLYGKYKLDEKLRAVQKNNKLTREYLVSLSSKFNSYIRYYGPRKFMELLCSNNGDIFKVNFKTVKELDTLTISKLKSEAKVHEFNNIVVCVFDKDDSFFDDYLVRNYIGILASKFANEKKKLALVMMPSLFDYENDKDNIVFTYSVRDYLNRDSITHFRELGMDAHGHLNAFGGTIPRNFAYYTLADIDMMVGNLRKIERDIVIKENNLLDYITQNKSTIDYIGLNNSILKDRIVIEGNLRGYMKNRTYFKEIVCGELVFKTYKAHINLYSKVRVVPVFNGRDMTLIVEQDLG